MFYTVFRLTCPAKLTAKVGRPAIRRRGGIVVNPFSGKEERWIETSLSGYALINHPMLNKGTAFTDEERDAFGLHGLLPPHVGAVEDQIKRRMRALNDLPSGFEQYAFLRELQDTNETLFYALLVSHVEQMLPLVYTPTVGEGCQRFSEIWRKPRGLFLSYPHKDRIAGILAHPRFDQVRCIVVSDGERILGLGDQGAGGMGIPIGKLSLYTALAGIHPSTTLPILLDVGTDNQERLHDPIYIGWCHERVRGQAYDDFIESFVAAVIQRWPHVLLQWEDFAGSNAARLLERYRDRLCTFNDDIQGTAAVATATLLAAINVTGKPLRDQRIAFLGFGSAGVGIASLMVTAMEEAGLSQDEASARVYAVDKDGLLVEGYKDLHPTQQPFVKERSLVEGWKLAQPDKIGLLDVIHNAKPTVLIGVSGMPGVFSEEIVRAMASSAERPIIFPLSNPTSRSEATPQDLLNWTNGTAVIGTGSPFPPVSVNGQSIPIDQTNNSYVFPGVALGIVSSQARRVTDAMFMVAAKTLANLSPTVKDKKGRLLPPVTEIRSVSMAIAMAVAEQARKEKLAQLPEDKDLELVVRSNVWEPRYLPYRLKK
jgi:malate dehydrogenase (oxaloacetate-decarboxylating)